MISIIWSMSSGFLSGGLRALLDRRDELVLVQLLTLAGGADEAVAGAARVLGHLRAARGDVDRDTALGHVVDRGALGACSTRRRSRPGRRATARASTCTDSRRRAKRSLNSGHSPSYPVAISLSASPVPDAEEDPVRVQAPHRGEGLRDDGGVVAERRRQHRGARAPGAWCARRPRSSTPARTARGRPRGATAGSGR